MKKTEEKELLVECKLQLEYLNEKFVETGTTNALLAKIVLALSQPTVIKSVCYHCEGKGFVYRDPITSVKRTCRICKGQTVL